MFRKIRISAIALLITGTLAAQNTGIKVHVFDNTTKLALPFANVIVEQGDRQIAGTTTDVDGYAEIKPLEPGSYNVKAVYQQYKDYATNGVQVVQDNMAHLEINMLSVADTIAQVIVIYQAPIISKRTITEQVVDSDIMGHLAGGISGAVQNVNGVVANDVGGDIHIKGGRPEDNVYIIDGQVVDANQGNGSIPKSMISDVNVITGGTPAKYGDVTGGIIEINTLAGTDHLFGSVQGYSSNMFDAFHNNDVDFSIGAPLWTKTDSNKYKHTIVDFIVGGDYLYKRDQNPSFLGTYFLDPADMAAIDANPITASPSGGFDRSAEFITANQIVSQAWHPNDAQDIIGVNGKINFHISDLVKVTIGGSYQFQTQHDYTQVYQMFNSVEDPLHNYTDYKGYIRFTQRFYTPPDTKDKKTLIKNAFYSLQAEYSHRYEVEENANFGANFFEYGYVGQFYQYRTPFYGNAHDGSKGIAYYMQSYSDSLLTFKPGSYNPIAANYTSDVYNGLGAANIQNYPTVQANLGLMNGDRPGNVYSLWYNVGRSYGGQFLNNANEFRFSADFSAEIANNSIDLGFQYEQNNISQYNINAVGLWTLMRQLANFQLSALDTLHPVLVKSGTYSTYNYNYLPNTGAEYQFDKSLREEIYHTTNLTQAEQTAWIQPDNYAPSMYSLNMFSASDLLNSGSSYVSYFGYDYKGNLLSTSPSLNDFFNQKDANGNNTYTMGAYRPIYMAGYIEDNFDVKTISFNVGLRVDQFNANEDQLSDPYLLFPAKTAGEVGYNSSLGQIPSNIGSNYVVYVNNSLNPTSIVGYRNGNNWYNASGNLVSDPTVIASQTASGNIQPDLKYPNQTALGSNAFSSYVPQTKVSPRLAFAFPITDKASFYAHYDILTQRPPGGGTSSVNLFIPTNYLFIQSQTGQVLQNPALIPQETTDYELGFSQYLNESKSMAVTISAYYKSFQDEIQAYRFYEAYPTTYMAYANLDFGTVKGFAVSYELRRLGDIRFRANYTLMFATGTGSGPTSGVNLAASGEPNLQIPQALSYDQRHTFTANFDFHFKEGKSYDGPSITLHNGDQVQILSNAGINVNFVAASGTPYTQWTLPNQQGIGLPSHVELTGSINGNNLPWSNRVDVRADKMFKLMIKGHACQATVYIEATNVLNTENVLTVYNYTGSPTDDGYLASPAGKQTIAGQISPQSFVAQYTAYEKQPTYFSMPRQARLGLVFNF